MPMWDVVCYYEYGSAVETQWLRASPSNPRVWVLILITDENQEVVWLYSVNNGGREPFCIHKTTPMEQHQGNDVYKDKDENDRQLMRTGIKYIRTIIITYNESDNAIARRPTVDIAAAKVRPISSDNGR
ncbi:hypothetical protein EVAR_27293_1 [Eumeta japonica]|uniref:Uncharacterized protein n=1 Tax=Eumeta variegata TaxID=151549 RepID=A0A4C1UD66_EUMVA|nr:hypothetical protein EVAR_27293_1 [Eumeta japonica]